MGCSEWLAANGYDEAQLSANQRKHLEAAWKAETQPATAPTLAPAPTAPPAAPSSSFDEQMAAIERENERVETIRQVTAEYCQQVVGNRQKIDRFKSLCEAAVKDQKCTVDSFRYTMLREERSIGPMILTPQAPQVNDDVLEAAICVTHKLPDVEKKFSAQTLESAHRQFRRGLGLTELLMMGARQNGFRGGKDDWAGLCRHNVRRSADGDQYGGGYGFQSSVGPSTGIQVPGILGNTANKFLAAAFMFVSQAWRGIAKIRPVTDFKQITTYRMSGNNTFLRVAPSGEIKHGALSETSYTNQAKTFGRLLGISREDIINDDLGAFIAVAMLLGRGAADALNNIFWATWLDDASFFTTGNANYDDGATDSVLSLAGLDNAEAIFANQTKPDGTPLGAAAKILLVPNALKNTALQLMMNAPLVVGTTPASGPSANVFAGRYTVVPSEYLHRTSLPDENGVSQTVTGTSTAWWLLADPMDIPGIEVVFLNGQETPTVETDEFEFDRLGLATRAYYDFGVAKQEYRCGVKLKGAA